MGVCLSCSWFKNDARLWDRKMRCAAAAAAAVAAGTAGACLDWRGSGWTGLRGCEGRECEVEGEEDHSLNMQPKDRVCRLTWPGCCSSKHLSDVGVSYGTGGRGPGASNCSSGSGTAGDCGLLLTAGAAEEQRIVEFLICRRVAGK